MWTKGTSTRFFVTLPVSCASRGTEPPELEVTCLGRWVATVVVLVVAKPLQPLVATIRLGQIQTLHKQFLWVGVSQISVDHLSIAAIAFWFCAYRPLSNRSQWFTMNILGLMALVFSNSPHVSGAPKKKTILHGSAPMARQFLHEEVNGPSLCRRMCPANLESAFRSPGREGMCHVGSREAQSTWENTYEKWWCNGIWMRIGAPFWGCLGILIGLGFWLVLTYTTMIIDGAPPIRIGFDQH